ncbi:MAG: glutamate racemase [Lachnospiraceae bacterium]
MTGSMYKDFIGVFDSGVGGISVLKELYKELPNENFLYYGDSKNTPYGDKTKKQILELSTGITEYFLEQEVKAIVIACNTATSAAAKTLREKYREIPILGIEPALKPAAMKYSGKRLLVLATAATLKLDKFQRLKSAMEDRDEIISLSCSGLAERIQEGNLEGPDLKRFLEELLAPYIGKVDGVVLGCTHYPFIKKQLQEILGEVELFDGANGTARELRRQLTLRGLLSTSECPGEIVFQSSRDTKEELQLYEQFFHMEI